MARNFGEIAFSAEVKKMQERLGSRKSYARLEKEQQVDGLTGVEIEYISRMDHFYMASNSESGYPYIQHRGGPKGFIKVLEPKKIGIVDFRGNMQFVSVGNIMTNNKVSMIMVNYPARERLKIFARASIVEFADDPELHARLDLHDYPSHPERMIVFDIDAYDWNCPQHITPRYTLEDIRELFNSQSDHIHDLEAEIQTLKKKLRSEGQI
ncbi:MAG: pyridoxamine 5'-phosphate oxidase family protein [Chitinophagaceae bacterium]